MNALGNKYSDQQNNLFSTGFEIDPERAKAIAELLYGQIPMSTSEVMNAINRGSIGGTLGAPVDIANEALRPVGLATEKPFLGSEWFGDKMQDMGMVTGDRKPLAEMVAGFVDPGSALVGLLKGAKGIPLAAGIFAGKNAKLADLLKMNEAEKMLGAGEDAAKVWKDTGWGRGPDGKMRFEIPDNEILFNRSYGPRFSRLDMAVDHEKLLNQYPEIANARLNQDPELNGGSYFKDTNTINTTPGNKSTLVHELQHAIQEREGFARGGSPGVYYPDERDAIAREVYRSLRTSPEYANAPAHEVYGIAKQYANTTESGGRDIYKRLAGEAEARLTQARMNMTPEERAAQYPWNPDYFQQATGVPINNLIFRDVSPDVAAHTVYHGSPHQFNAFDASKIGTGEGAQAYGHGIYFAESPDVAKTYKSAGSDASYSRVTGGMTPIEEAAFDAYSKGMSDDDVFSLMHNRYLKNATSDKEFDAVDNAIKQARSAQGNFYTADLPDEWLPKMLDWDKPLSEQSEFVKDRVNGMGIHTVPEQYYDAKTADLFSDLIAGGLKDGDISAQAYDPTGREIYWKLGGDTNGHDSISSLGIPGIRYLDGSSRGAGEGTSNFVVFPGNEHLVKILKRNGNPIE